MQSDLFDLGDEQPSSFQPADDGFFGSPEPREEVHQQVEQQQEVEDVNSPLKVYQREHEERLAQQNQRSRQEHEKIRANARSEIDKFYEERRQKREKAMRENRSAEASLHKSFVQTSSGDGGSWERVVQLIDLNAGKIDGKGAAPPLQTFIESISNRYCNNRCVKDAPHFA